MTKSNKTDLLSSYMAMQIPSNVILTRARPSIYIYPNMSLRVVMRLDGHPRRANL